MNKINALNVSKIKVMLTTAALCVSVNGYTLLDNLNKRLMLKITINLKDEQLKSTKKIESSTLIMRSFNNMKFFEKKRKIIKDKMNRIQRKNII